MPKNEFDYYYGAEAEQFSFVKIPKVLFSDVFYEGYTHRQAAELMGVNRSTIEVYISRALAKIKKKLDDMDIM